MTQAAATPLLSIEHLAARRSRRRLLVALCLFAALAGLPPLFAAIGEPFWTVVVSRVMIFAIAALSLDLILGYGALVSFGHAAFLGIGAYAAAILSSHGVSDLGLHLGAALGAAALFALVTGAISLRTRGVYFIMITLAFGQMAFFFAVSLSAYGGDDGLSLPARSTILGVPAFAGNAAFYYLVLSCLTLLFLFATAIVGSRFGRVLTGTRENAVRMEAIGFRPFPYQLTAYVLSGMMAAIAGVLLANQTGFVSPAYMSWGRSGELIAMVVLGGIGTLLGPVLGALAFVLLEEWLATFTQHWRIVFGAILILAVLFTKGGLYGAARRLFAGRTP